jgi:hypothetical protein
MGSSLIQQLLLMYTVTLLQKCRLFYEGNISIHVQSNNLNTNEKTLLLNSRTYEIQLFFLLKNTENTNNIKSILITDGRNWNLLLI